MLNLHRYKKIVRREPGRDGKIVCDHRQDGNDEVHRLVMSLEWYSGNLAYSLVRKS